MVLKHLLKHKGRCHCHKPRHERPRLVLLCDVILAVMLVFVGVLALRAWVLPGLGIDIDISWLVDQVATGAFVALAAIALNFVWAVYYGCKKAAGGAILSLLSGVIMLKLYGVF